MANMNLYSRNDKTFVIVNMVLIAIFTISTLYPFIYISALSLSSGFQASSGNVVITPVETTIEAYKYILSQRMFWVSYGNTFFYTIFGTLCSLLFLIPGAYALSRPPGHHAFGDLAGGFCFLNNAGIAAERLRAAGLRPAILDVDVHHGNGTQGIFYGRDDVLTVSLHADPARFYPFFWGHAQERGEGRGTGCNLNLPLPRGTDYVAYLAALEIALERVGSFGTEVLVVALGLDASIDDPFKGFAVTQDGFARIGAAIAKAGLPTLFVQEGGYLSPSLGANLTRTLTGFQGG